MAEVVWSSEALARLEAIRRYIGQFDQVAAARFSRRLFSAGEGLAAFPKKGRPIEGGYRELVLVRPYVILYDVRGSTVEILSIRHAAQRPAAD